MALIVVLDSLEAPDLDQPGKRQLVCVANTHIHANPELKDVKLWQVLTSAYVCSTPAKTHQRQGHPIPS